MGTLTLGTGTDNFRTRVAYRMSERDEFASGTVDGRVRLDEAINNAYRHVCLPNVFSHPELKTTGVVTLATGTRSYSLIANIPLLWATRFIVYEGTGNAGRFQRLKPENAIRMAERQFDSTLLQPSGRPYRYAIDGHTLLLDKYPTATENGIILRVYHWRVPTALTATSHVTLIADLFDQIIVEGATFYAWLAIGQAARADFYRDLFARLVNEVREPMDIEADDPGYRAGVEHTADYMGL